MQRKFVNYAHRGASEYMPENTLLSFYTGISMGANGIETDVRRTKDGVLVLFHDDTLMRVTGEEGSIADYTFEELQKFTVKHEGFEDKIVTFEEFLQKFSWRDLTFAIELKEEGTEEEVAELIRRHNVVEKTVVTSFHFEYIQKIKEYAPELQVGWLFNTPTEERINTALELGFTEVCPKAVHITSELVEHLHDLGLRVRAWGVTGSHYMRNVYNAGADGMTVNFPDWLTRYIERTK